MKHLSENELIIHLLEQVLAKLDEIEQRLEKQDDNLNRHNSVKHTFISKGKRYRSEPMRDTQVAERR
jgi:hypothetical protein